MTAPSVDDQILELAREHGFDMPEGVTRIYMPPSDNPHYQSWWSLNSTTQSPTPQQLHDLIAAEFARQAHAKTWWQRAIIRDPAAKVHRAAFHRAMKRGDSAGAITSLWRQANGS